MKYNVFINEIDVFYQVDFRKYDCFDQIYKVRSQCNRKEVDVLCVGLNDVIDNDFVSSFPNLKYILSPTTGIDHIQISKPDISVINLMPYEIKSVSATAEHTMALMLALIRKIPFIDHRLSYNRSLYRGTELKDKKIGIFGLGRIGSLVRDYCTIFGMDVISYDSTSDASQKLEILSNCNIISVHLPLNGSTENFLGMVDFYKMGRKPYIINTARAQIINRKALIYALKYNYISGAALDFANYNYGPMIDSDFVQFLDSKLIVTPHIGGNTEESVEKTANTVVEKFVNTINI